MASRTETHKNTFTDWDGGVQVLKIHDNGDSISIEVEFASGDQAISVTASVRIRPDDLEAVEAEIRRIRQARGI